MGKSVVVYNHSSEVYKQPKARKVVLFVGFALSLVAIIVGLVALISFFFPEVGSGVASLFSKPLLEVEKTLCWIGIATSIAGVIFSVAGANAMKPIARLSFLFVILSFFISIAILVMAYLGMFIANVVS